MNQLESRAAHVALLTGCGNSVARQFVHAASEMYIQTPVRIPMRGRCDSIHVAVAAGVLLFDMAHPANATHSTRRQVDWPTLPPATDAIDSY